MAQSLCNFFVVFSAEIRLLSDVAFPFSTHAWTIKHEVVARTSQQLRVLEKTAQKKVNKKKTPEKNDLCPSTFHRFALKFAARGIFSAILARSPHWPRTITNRRHVVDIPTKVVVYSTMGFRQEKLSIFFATTHTWPIGILPSCCARVMSFGLSLLFFFFVSCLLFFFNSLHRNQGRRYY